MSSTSAETGAEQPASHHKLQRFARSRAPAPANADRTGEDAPSP